jgi:hypothetical protein
MIITMSAPLQTVFAEELKIPAHSIRALVDGCCERKQSGVIRLHSGEGSSLYLFFNKGNPFCSYIVTSDDWKSVPVETWAAWIDSAGDCHTRFTPLSMQGMLIFKLLIQSSACVTRRFSNHAELAGYLEAQKNNSTALLVQFDWKDATGAILFGTQDAPHSIFISADDLSDQPGIAPSIQNPVDMDFTASILRKDAGPVSGHDRPRTGWSAHSVDHDLRPAQGSGHRLQLKDSDRPKHFSFIEGNCRCLPSPADRYVHQLLRDHRLAHVVFDPERDGSTTTRS